eukprot:11174586-Lingulodinium_polyedra.AAC.1
MPGTSGARKHRNTVAKHSQTRAEHANTSRTRACQTQAKCTSNSPPNSIDHSTPIRGWFISFSP